MNEKKKFGPTWVRIHKTVTNGKVTAVITAVLSLGMWVSIKNKTQRILTVQSCPCMVCYKCRCSHEDCHARPPQSTCECEKHINLIDEDFISNYRFIYWNNISDWGEVK